MGKLYIPGKCEMLSDVLVVGQVKQKLSSSKTIKRLLNLNV